ncbi:MAG TPA: hypothetical protein VEF55_02050 [Candidatus Binatia bacterium]|nr:hypothetical protein [Candidatus Binatia bacterium]
MIKPAPPKPRGIAGVLFVCFFGVATAGVLIDLLVLSNGSASILAAPGGRAVLGVAVAAGAAIIGFALRFTLGRPIKEEGGSGVRDSA